MEPSINPPPPPLTSPPVLPSPAVDWRLYFELLSFAAFVLPTIGNILGPLVLWLLKKDSVPEADIEGKKVLNFNISWTIWGFLTCGLGFLVWLVISIVAAIKAANHEPFKHPLTIPFLK